MRGLGKNLQGRLEPVSALQCLFELGCEDSDAMGSVEYIKGRYWDIPKVDFVKGEVLNRTYTNVPPNNVQYATTSKSDAKKLALIVPPI